MLYGALAIMTLVMVIFALAWLRSPQLRRYIEEPKYRLLNLHDEEGGGTP